MMFVCRIDMVVCYLSVYYMLSFFDDVLTWGWMNSKMGLFLAFYGFQNIPMKVSLYFSTRNVDRDCKS